jgi:2-C-methyl-D-erythritol 4-phosphate cytidylyltransferase/2-C-methyl-D-erythritol 2,4-cyclodiphosphate synthase
MVVISKEHQALYDEASANLQLLPCAYGGETRQISAKNGLIALSKYKPNKVLIHDAARPLIIDDLISEVVLALNNFEAVDICMDVPDTIRDRKDARKYLDRSELYLAQTPQGFQFTKILDLHEKFRNNSYTDDISLAIEGGLKLGLIKGNRSNFKITTEEDFKMAEAYLRKEPQIRIGSGFDVHETVDGEGGIPICGIRIPCSKRVIAHSDGDVGLHALMDAILGALSLGDIGEHFPPTDKRWKDADSKDLLQYVKNLMAEKNAEVSNIDITILCESPKIKPYREQMIKCVSKILELNENQVSVKATTTEKLGFIGRQEGIAAQAVCILKLH